MWFLYLLGCGTIDKLLTIEISESTQVTVEKGTLLEEFLSDVGFDDFVSMNLVESQALSNQGVQPGDIEHVYLTLLEMEAIEPTESDLSFFDQMTFFASAPNIERAQIASASSFPEGQGLVSFDLADVDLTDYVVSESMTLTTDVTARRPAEDTLIEARFTVTVEATLQGAKNQLD
jgi:hypothetical protein